MRQQSGRPKVVFVSGSEVVWGAELNLLAVAEGLREFCDVSLLAPDGHLAEAWSTAALGERLRVVATGRSRIRRLTGFLTPILRIRGPVTFVVFDTNVLPAVVALRPVLLLSGSRIVLNLHYVFRKARGLRRLRTLTRLVDTVVAISEYTAQQLPASAKVRVINQPIPAPQIAIPETAGSVDVCVLRIGAVGRIDEEKQLDVVIDALGLLPDAVLFLRGAPEFSSTDYLAELKHRSEAVCPGRCFFEGRVDGSRAFDGIDLLVCANPNEAAGRVVAEAQFRGIPVVVPDRGGCAEFVEEGVSGFRYRALDAASLAHVLRDLSDDRERIETMKASTREYASARYDVSRDIREYWHALSVPARKQLVVRHRREVA